MHFLTYTHILSLCQMFPFILMTMKSQFKNLAIRPLLFLFSPLDHDFSVSVPTCIFFFHFKASLSVLMLYICFLLFIYRGWTLMVTIGRLSESLIVTVDSLVTTTFLTSWLCVTEYLRTWFLIGASIISLPSSPM